MYKPVHPQRRHDEGNAPELAEPLNGKVCDMLGAQRGVFGATMEVELVNYGPVTLMVEL